MTHDQIILTGFVVLALGVFLFVVKKGLHSKHHLGLGVGALVILSGLAIGLHSMHAASMADSAKWSFPLQDMALGVLFVALAIGGCCCGDRHE